MEKKKLGNILANTGSAVRDTFGKTKERVIHTVDQNNDGKLDLSDVSVVADAVGNAMKKGATAVKESAEENRKRIELKTLLPIFPDTLDQADFLMSKLVRVAERDKKHAESDVCQGSIGFLSEKGGLRVVNIFRDSLNIFGLSFYPNADYEFYYVNPTDRDHYICLSDYFAYLKIMRINELQRVAQDLGAKHFKVTYKEETTSSSDVKRTIHGKAAKVADADYEHHATEKKFSMVEVAAELHMAGHAPQQPTLVYLVKDDNVQNLIHLRMNGGEDFHNHKISIKLINSSGIKESDAIKIDGVLKAMKVSGNATVSNEARNESRRYLEYEIDF